MAMGTCKLTQNYGKYVKSHIIPKALTYPEVKGQHFVQFGEGSAPKKRWSSWYDTKLVIGEGEKILADLDTWAINFFRKKRLVWSGWGPMQSISVENMDIPGIKGWGIRQVEVHDPAKLRRFTLSLLWRAAASKMPEFNDVYISPRYLERLRKTVLNEQTENEAFYPAIFIQLSTLGVIHNHAPLAQNFSIPSFEGTEQRNIPIFRFYFDGLIIRFFNHVKDDGYTKSLGDQVVGHGNNLIVPAVKFENSMQAENIFKIFQDYNSL